MATYTDKKIEMQLLRVEDDFLSDNTKNYFDDKDNTIYLSKIFKWYEDDFSGSLTPLYKKIIKKKSYKIDKIEYLDYDWGLNELK